jgi:formylmethanofuran dehydrogenase subunit E
VACRGAPCAGAQGARARFGSHLIDRKLEESDLVVTRVSTGKTVHVVIDAASCPKDVRTQVKKIESGRFEPAHIDLFQDLQWADAKKLVSRPAIESVDVTDNPDCVWPELPCKNLGKCRDNAFKNVPEAR